MLKIILSISFFLIAGLAQANDGVYEIQGTHQTRGYYSGELELRTQPNGAITATQALTYQNFFHAGLKIQELWTGVAIPTPAGFRIDISLARQDFIRRLDNLSRTAADASPEQFSIQLERDGRGGFISSYLNSYNQNLRFRSPLTALPLYQIERSALPTNGKVEGLKRKLVDRMFRKFQDDEFIRRYRDRQEYKDGVHYMIHDRTDYSFYRTNPNILRIVNKVIDPISLVESTLRRNAFAPSLDEKAQGYGRDIRRHIDKSGMYSHAKFDEKGNFIGNGDDGDSALWTGVYIAGEAFRYRVTKDPSALENMKYSLRGILTLVEITEDPNKFARTLEIYDAQKPLGQGWHRGNGRFAHLNWLEGGNNDMFKGLIYSMIFAHLYLPTNEIELRNEMRAIAYKINELEITRESKWNKPLSQGLVALLSGDSNEREKYLRTYDDPLVAYAELKLNDTFYFAGITDWSGLHLSTISSICAITLADQLGAAEISQKLREKYFTAWKEVRETDRHFMTLTLQAFASSAISGDYLGDVQNRLQDAIWGLREIPYPRPRYNLEWDHTMKPTWVASPFPRLPWKFLKDDPPPPSFGFQGIFAYPLFEATALSSNYIWKDTGYPFQGTSDANTENGSVDYLHWYWLARMIGVIPTQDYQDPNIVRPPLPMPPPINPPAPITPPPPHVVPPPPAPPIVAYELGNGTTLKFVDKEFEFNLPPELHRAGVAWIRLSSNKEETDVREFFVTPINAGDTPVEVLKGNLGKGAVKDAALDGRPLRRVWLKARSGNWRGSPGEFKVTLGIRRH